MTPPEDPALHVSPPQASRAERWPADALPKDTVVAGYVIRSILGRGGFGITYRAENPQTGKVVALKEFFLEGFVERDGIGLKIAPDVREQYEPFLEKFKASTSALQKLKHPAIVQVYGYVDGHLYHEGLETGFMVMEFVEGETLGRWLRHDPKSRMRLEVLRPVFEKVMDALAYIHDRDLMHRDLKPDNIMIRADGSPVLIDFGAVGEGLRRENRASTKVSGHTPGYSPPEQSMRQGAQGAHTDVYGLCATIYACLAGNAPPDSTERSASVVLKRTDSYRPLAAMVREPLPPQVASAIDRGLILDAAARIRDIRSLRAEMGWGGGAPAPTAEGYAGPPPADATVPFKPPSRAEPPQVGLAAAPPIAPSWPSGPQVAGSNPQGPPAPPGASSWPQGPQGKPSWPQASQAPQAPQGAPSWPRAPQGAPSWPQTPQGLQAAPSWPQGPHPAGSQPQAPQGAASWPQGPYTTGSNPQGFAGYPQAPGPAGSQPQGPQGYGAVPPYGYPGPAARGSVPQGPGPQGPGFAPQPSVPAQGFGHPPPAPSGGGAGRFGLIAAGLAAVGLAVGAAFALLPGAGPEAPPPPPTGIETPAGPSGPVRVDAEAQRRREEEARRTREAAEAERLRREEETRRTRDAAEAERLRREDEIRRARDAAEADRLRREEEARRTREAAEAERQRRDTEALRQRQLARLGASGDDPAAIRVILADPQLLPEVRSEAELRLRAAQGQVATREGSLLAGAGFDPVQLEMLNRTAQTDRVRDEARRRLDIIARERTEFANTGDDLVRLRIYVNACQACLDATAARTRIAALETRERERNAVGERAARLQASLDAAGNDPVALRRFIDTECATDCALHREAQRRLELANAGAVTREQQELDAARWNETELNRILRTASNDRIRSEAIRRLSVVQREAAIVRRAGDDPAQLRDYLRTCEACVERPAIERRLNQPQGQPPARPPQPGPFFQPTSPQPPTSTPPQSPGINLRDATDPFRRP